MSEHNKSYLARVTICIFFIMYGLIFYFFPIKKLSINSESFFPYFLSIDDNKVNSPLIFDMPIVNQLHKNSSVLSSLTTYIAVDKRLVLKKIEISLKINSAFFDFRPDAFVCDTLYPGICLVSIPNQSVATKTVVEVDKKNFSLGESTQTTLGIVFHLGSS